ncbi:PAS domain S-box protein [Bacillus sp. B15-48]|nr:PAS domain S-box protein [Bacillus sp. B15-48]
MHINDTGVALIGASTKEEIIGRGIFDFLVADSFEAYHKYIAEVNKGVLKGFTNHKFYRKDGTIFEAEVKGIQTSFENSSAIHLIVRDIDKRRKAENFLLQSEKLLVAGQLAAGIAHEVRNPLTAIKGFLQLTEGNFKENRTYFEIINDEINRIEAILTELLTLAKPKDMNFQQNNITNLIDEVTTLLDTEALMNNVEINTIIQPEIPPIYCDTNQLKQVFINFIKNSIEAMPNGGLITIHMERHNCEQIKLLFSDTGCGIPESLLNRIEEPFFTTKEKGTGLGLMISKQIIERHNGRIKYYSSKEGTTIELLLPISKTEQKSNHYNHHLQELTQLTFAMR